MFNSNNPKASRGLFGFHLFLFFVTGSFLLSLFLAPYVASQLGVWGLSGRISETLYNTCGIVYDLCQFICHQRPERSFMIGSIPMPLCVRCVGMALGTFAVACVTLIILPRGDILEKLRQCFFLQPKINPWIIIAVLLLFAAPMILDGFAQLIFPYSSVEITRFLTGLFFGYFRGAVLIEILSAILHLGREGEYSYWQSNN